jgi:membrane-associated phospholipid phosphatase
MATGPDGCDLPEPPGLLATLSVPLLAGALAGLLLATGSSEAVFRAVNSWPSATGDALWANLTVLGEGAAMLALAGCLTGRRPRVLVAALLAALLVTVLLHPIKDLVAAERPARVLGRDAVHVIGQKLSRRSFPSGHAATIFAAAALACALCRGAAARTGILLLAALVAVSRLAVGAHWPLDALAGAALGWPCTCVALRLAGRWPVPGRMLQLALAVLPLLAAVWVALPGSESDAYEAVRPVLAACGLLFTGLGLRVVLQSGE